MSADVHAGDLTREHICASDEATGAESTVRQMLGLSFSARLMDFVTLTKPEVLFMVLMTTAAGSVMASSHFEPLMLVNALIGTALIAGGTAALNHLIERRFDGAMRRTKNRPLPAGRMAPQQAFAFGVILAAAGAMYLALTTNTLTCAIGLAALLSYLLVYTPLKRRSGLCTLVGAFPGAAPILMGFAAVHGSLTLEAWLLYAILFLWQFPHFLAIGWIYRDDYARAGMFMLPENDSEGDAAFMRVWITSAVLVVLSIVPVVAGMAGLVYLVVSAALGLFLVVYVRRASSSRTNASAKQLLHATVIYLPLLLIAMVADRGASYPWLFHRA